MYRMIHVHVQQTTADAAQYSTTTLYSPRVTEEFNSSGSHNDMDSEYMYWCCRQTPRACNRCYSLHEEQPEDVDIEHFEAVGNSAEGHMHHL